MTQCKCGAVSASDAALKQMSEEERKDFHRRLTACPTCRRDRKTKS